MHWERQLHDEARASGAWRKLTPLVCWCGAQDRVVALDERGVELGSEGIAQLIASVRRARLQVFFLGLGTSASAGCLAPGGSLGAHDPQAAAAAPLEFQHTFSMGSVRHCPAYVQPC